MSEIGNSTRQRHLILIRTKSVCGQRYPGPVLAASQSWLRAKRATVAIGAPWTLRRQRGAGLGSERTRWSAGRLAGRKSPWCHRRDSTRATIARVWFVFAKDRYWDYITRGMTRFDDLEWHFVSYCDVFERNFLIYLCAALTSIADVTSDSFVYV